MMRSLLQLDHTCFLFINNKLSNPVFDYIMPLFHHTKYFLPFLVLPWFFAVYNDKKNRWKLALLIPIVIILVDQTGLLIKKMVLRPRPFMIMDLDMINHLVNPSGNNLSFPSNHAANTAALATVFSSIYNRYYYIFWSLAITVMFSRIYIGVHYPADVLAGCFLGAGIGIIIIEIYKLLENIKSPQLK